MTTRRNYECLAWIFYLLVNVAVVEPNCLQGYSSFGGNCYGAPKDALYTWAQAEDACVLLGGHLTSVTSQAEHNFILQLISQYKAINPELWNEVWIGLYHPSPVTYPSDYATKRQGWRWIDRMPYTFTSWDPLDPSNHERYARLSHGRWLGSLTGNGLHNFICKIVVNRFRVEVPQPYPSQPRFTVGGLYPNNKWTTRPNIFRPRISTTGYAPVAPTLRPIFPNIPDPTVRPTIFHNIPTLQPTTFHNIPRIPPRKPSTIFQVITPTTPSKNNNRDSKSKDERNSVDTNSDQKPRSQKKVEELETANTGFSTKLIPVAAIVPAVAIVMIAILAFVLCRSPKLNIYGDSDRKSSITSITDTKSSITTITDTRSTVTQDFRMTPLSTLRDPTSAQYYNATYRSLSSLFRKAPNTPITPPVYNNVESGMNTIKSCYENNYIG